MASSYRPVGQRLILDDIDDPTSAFSVSAHKICDSESAGVSCLPWVFVLGKIFYPCERHIKIVEAEIDGAAIYRQEAFFFIIAIVK